MNRNKRLTRVCGSCKRKYDFFLTTCPYCKASKEDSVTFFIGAIEKDYKESDVVDIWNDIKNKIKPDGKGEEFKGAILDANSLFEDILNGFIQHYNEENKRLTFFEKVKLLNDNNYNIDEAGIRIAKQVRNICAHENMVFVKDKLNYKQSKLAVYEYGKALVQLGALKEKDIKSLNIKNEIKEDNYKKVEEGSNKYDDKVKIAYALIAIGSLGIIFIVINLLLK